MMPGERAPARGAPQPATGRVRRKAAGSARARTALDWNKHATQETRSFGQAGRGVPSPSGSRHTGNWKDSLENSQTGVTALPGGRGSPPPHREEHLWVLLLGLEWTDTTEHAAGTGSAWCLQSRGESRGASCCRPRWGSPRTRSPRPAMHFQQRGSESSQRQTGRGVASCWAPHPSCRPQATEPCSRVTGSPAGSWRCLCLCLSGFQPGVRRAEGA